MGIRKPNYFKLVGIIFALGYLISFVGVWIYFTWFNSFTYIPYGEPNLFIKYSEWIIGFIAIGSLISEGKNEIDLAWRRTYDPLV